MRRNCPEVENLMDGKMPFVTRCGITFVELPFHCRTASFVGRSSPTVDEGQRRTYNKKHY